MNWVDNGSADPNWPVEKLEGADPDYKKDRSNLRTVLFENDMIKFKYNAEWEVRDDSRNNSSSQIRLYNRNASIGSHGVFTIFVHNLKDCKTCIAHKLTGDTLKKYEEELKKQLKLEIKIQPEGCFYDREYYRIDKKILNIGDKKIYYWSIYESYSDYGDRARKDRNVETLYIEENTVVWLLYSPYFIQPPENDIIDYQAKIILETLELKK
jgi:hypothetical protein